MIFLYIKIFEFFDMENGNDQNTLNLLFKTLVNLGIKKLLFLKFKKY